MLTNTNNVKELKKLKLAMIGLIIVSVGLYICGTTNAKSLHQNFIVTTGKINAVTNLGRSSPRAEYTYVIKGKIYTGSEPHPNFQNFHNRHLLVGKIFPVVVDSTNYNNKQMLFDSLSFNRYGLLYPDSLRWLTQFLK